LANVHGKTDGFIRVSPTFLTRDWGAGKMLDDFKLLSRVSMN
jgi:hypothetical protein